MKNKHLRYTILLGILVLACLMVVQIYWFKKAFDVTEKQLDHSIQVALKKVADSVATGSEIRKMSSNFFFVATHAALNNEVLDTLLKKELLRRSLSIDYELGVYNAEDDTLVYGNYVEATKKRPLPEKTFAEERHDIEKNFAVYFPKKQSYVASQMDVWIFSTVILLFMTAFFAYAMMSLLREKRFSEIKNDFINNMTHELKTPVTNIRIAGEILQKKMSGEAANHVYIDILLKENERLRQKIDQVLTSVSVDYMNRPRQETLNLHELIEGCAATFQLRVEERKGKIQLELNASSNCIVGDKEMLVQAITNVIDNAEKYSTGQPHIHIHTKDAGNGIEIDIQDRGIGIAPDMRSKVFEKFFRIPTGNIHTVKGFGLGLSFVKSVIRAHRGQVDLFSELNKGTEVRIILPKA